MPGIPKQEPFPVLCNADIESLGTEQEHCAQDFQQNCPRSFPMKSVVDCLPKRFMLMCFLVRTVCGVKSAVAFVRLQSIMRYVWFCRSCCDAPQLTVHVVSLRKGDCSTRVKTADMSEEAKYAWSVRCAAR